VNKGIRELLSDTFTGKQKKKSAATRKSHYKLMAKVNDRSRISLYEPNSSVEHGHNGIEAFLELVLEDKEKHGFLSIITQKLDPAIYSKTSIDVLQILLGLEDFTVKVFYQEASSNVDLLESISKQRVKQLSKKATSLFIVTDHSYILEKEHSYENGVLVNHKADIVFNANFNANYKEQRLNLVKEFSTIA